MQSPLLLSLPLQGSVLGRQYYLQGYMDMYFNNWIQIQVSQKACRKDPFERNDFVKNNLHASQCIGTNNTQIFSQLPVRTNTGKVVLIDSVILWQPRNHQVMNALGRFAKHSRSQSCSRVHVKQLCVLLLCLQQPPVYINRVFKIQ